MEHITKNFDYLENESYKFRDNLYDYCWKFGWNRAMMVATCLHDENVKLKQEINKLKQEINKLEQEKKEYIIKECVNELIDDIFKKL